MNHFKAAFVSVLILLSSSAYSNIAEIEKLASVMSEAKVLIETREFLRDLNEQRKKGIKINKSQALEVSDEIEIIAKLGSKCASNEENNVLRSQAYALVAGISGILSKESKNIGLGKKSYHALEKSRELYPDNTDAIKGQAVALNMILSKGWLVRKAAEVSLGIDLRDAQKELIDDLRRFPDRTDLERLADQLEDKL